MKRSVSIVVLGLGGLVAAVALTLGALALAGEDVGHVVQPVLIGEAHPTATATATATPSPSRDDHGGEHSGSPTASPSPDDHGGDSNHGGSGSDDSGGHGSGSGSGSGSGDSSGPGSGDD